MSDVPPEIITAILSRLPVKSLLRFRGVSKPWRALIDGRDFIKLHLRLSAETNSNRTLIVRSNELFWVDLDSFKLLDAGNIRFKPRNALCSCNGLVLLVSHSDEVALWNPSTRKLNKLPPPPVFSHFAAQYALGYDSKHDDYKVVRVVPDYEWREDEEDDELSDTSIYSVNSNSWKKVDGFPYGMDPFCSWGVCLNDALHKGFRPLHSPFPVIMAFDLAKEEPYEVPKPEFSGMVSVEVLGGCLAAVVSGKMNTSEIWVMKEYGVKESWVKLLCFDPPVAQPCRNLYPVAYSKDGDKVLLNYEGFCLNWFDLKTGAVTIACVDGLSASFGASADDPVIDAWECVRSLVSPFGPGGVGSGKKNGVQGKKGKEIKRKRRRKHPTQASERPLLLQRPGPLRVTLRRGRPLESLHEKTQQTAAAARVQSLAAQYALGYDSKHDDYKVVQVVPDSECEEGVLNITNIYSVNSNSWKNIVGFPYGIDPLLSWGVYLNDALHTGFRPLDSPSFPVIMAFDLAKEAHYDVPKPEFSGILSVEVLGGCLAAVISGKMNTSEIWVMKEYRVKDSWVKLLCFDPPVAQPCRDLYPVAYSKDGGKVLVNYEGFCLNWFDLKTGAVTIACVDGLSASFGASADDRRIDAWECVRSLVSPFGPGGVGGGKKNGVQGKKGKEIKKKRFANTYLVSVDLVLMQLCFANLYRQF
ncbi:F-box protein CPR30 [Striga hermonthica]|uniref:F-box protein CPR30 n=1 Tax=Striga hermonthica TaxID=68872 RepID=A0A9N7MZP1_STRHE|nr:F-box protein CPR30 [Striga hermonthica]